MIVDYHTHLRDPAEKIDHTLAGVERFVRAAEANGVDEVGIGEHVYYFAVTAGIWEVEYQYERCVYDIEAFVGAVLEAKERGWPVKLGLEVDYVADRQADLHALLEPYPWDYLLGSVHFLGHLAVDAGADQGAWVTHSVDEVWRGYFEAQARLAASGFVDVLAHPDLPKIYGRRPSDLAARYPHFSGVALEISTAGLHKHVGEVYPDPGFLAANPLPITLASDAHVPANVGRDYDRALALAREAGYETVTVFDSRVGRQEPLG